MQKNNKNRLIFLDALRGLAVLMVLVSHFSQKHILVIESFEKEFFQLGQAGVSLFFLISGFIIPQSLNTAPNLKVFWIHRFFRLYPMYWLSIFIALFLSLFGLYHLPQHDLFGILANFTMVQGFIKVPPIIGVFWSLKFEMIFYILMTFFVLIKFYKKPYQIFGIFSLIVITLAFISIISNFNFPYGIFHINLMLLGWILYHSSNHQIRSIVTYRVTFFVISFSAFMSAIAAFYGKVDASGAGTQSFIPMVTAWLSVICFFFYVVIQKEKLMFPSWLAWVGRISYSIYLLHVLVLSSLSFLFSKIGCWAILVWFLLSISLAAITYEFIEKPFVRLGKKFK